MEIILEKENFLNGIKIVEKITAQKAVQPVLSNILIETVSSDRVKFSATDLNQSISFKVAADVIKEGKITLNAKKLGEIILRLEEKPVVLSVDMETSQAKIACGRSNFELVAISANDFPNVFPDSETPDPDNKEFEINKNIFNKIIKQTIYSAAQNELASVLGGLCVTIEDNILEAAATDGNRLTRSRKEINSKGQGGSFIIPVKTLNELIRISSIIEDETLKLVIEKNKILFLFKDLKFSSKLIEGNYPKYQQLIPTNNEKKILIDREDLIHSIERVSVMVNERTNIIKFNFGKDSLEVCTDAPESGSGSDQLEIEYDFEELTIAFNYKYVLDALKNMETKNIKLEISTSLSASIIKESLEDTEKENNYVCLIMPVQVRK